MNSERPRRFRPGRPFLVSSGFPRFTAAVVSALSSRPQTGSAGGVRPCRKPAPLPILWGFAALYASQGRPPPQR
jgi:hypothetical protein